MERGKLPYLDGIWTLSSLLSPISDGATGQAIGAFDQLGLHIQTAAIVVAVAVHGRRRG